MEHKIYTISELKQQNIIANAPLSQEELQTATEILHRIHQRTSAGVHKGKGPFYAEIYDQQGHLVVASSNSVVEDHCSLHHAEINTIKLAHEKLKTYDLAPFKLTIYINAEPCIMCAGGIMWSGIERIFYSVPSADVEKLTGFDEGYKPDWVQEFAKRNIKVYGNIESESGKQVLADYVAQNHEIYKPSRS